MKRVLAFVLLAACAADKPPPPQAPVSNQAQPVPQPEPEQQANDASKAAREAEARVDQLARELVALNERMAAAETQLANAQSDADRSAGEAQLDQLNHQKAELVERAREALEAADRAQRRKGVRISPDCIDNPLAKGC